MTNTTHKRAARTTARRAGSIILAAVVLVGAARVGLALSSIDNLHADPMTTALAIDFDPPPLPATQPSGRYDDHDRRDRRDPEIPLGEADGVVPDGVTVFDDDTPAVANLDPDLLGALRRAATDAADDGVGLFVNSGWRSPAYQDQLLREAFATYGSEEEAARWVATADTSPHVSGDAVDIGPLDATVWLSEHGAEYGLCQIYGNEPWHFELRPDAIDDGCPPVYDDPTHDPRMQR